MLATLVAGGLASLVVDSLLFPLDTLKTRLQSESGLRALGGCSRLYSGLGPVLLGSAPGAAVFFLVYESCKSLGGSEGPQKGWGGFGGHLGGWGGHMVAAGMGEAAACVLRVPVEVVKQRSQAGAGRSGREVARNTWRREGCRGFYRGLAPTLAREVPFSLVQFPIWEFLKLEVARRSGQPATPWQSAVCGAAGGMVAGGLTTPLDVVKTRMMLGTGERLGTAAVLREIVRRRGWGGLWAGLGPRLAWIALGGTVFFGVYEQTLLLLG